MRYSSVGCTVVNPRSERRRLGFLVCAKCRRPALRRRTFPRAVILKRLAADFLVLMPLGRRIKSTFFQKERAIYVAARNDARTNSAQSGAVKTFSRGLSGFPCFSSTSGPVFVFFQATRADLTHGHYEKICAPRLLRLLPGGFQPGHHAQCRRRIFLHVYFAARHRASPLRRIAATCHIRSGIHDRSVWFGRQLEARDV